MKKGKILGTALILVMLSFLPVFTVNVVPEWTLRLTDKGGNAVPNVRVDQTWKHYSLEFFEGRHFDQTKSSDENGLVSFPARSIRVSAFSFAAAGIRSVLLRGHPHASYGPDAHVYCLGETVCNESYRQGLELPSISVVGQ